MPNLFAPYKVREGVAPMIRHFPSLLVMAETLKVEQDIVISYNQIHLPDPNMLEKMPLTTGFFCLAFGSSVPPVLVL